MPTYFKDLENLEQFPEYECPASQSTYTGVYARGGPTNTMVPKDLSSYLDRSEADVRGVKLVRSTASPSMVTNGESYDTTPSGARTPTPSTVGRKSMDRVR